MWRSLMGLVFGLLGLGVSVALGLEHAAMGSGGVGLMCGEGGGCAAVLGSRWAYVGGWTGGRVGAGVPVAQVGVVFYAVGVAVWLGVLGLGWRGLRGLAVLLGGMGALASAGFVGVQLVLIRAVCPLCMTSAVASVGLLVAGLMGWRGGEGGGAWPRLAVGLCGLGVVFAGLVGVWGLQSGVIGAGLGDSGGRVLARFDGVAITEGDFRREAEEDVFALELSAFEARARYVERKADGLALELEARRRGMTREALLREEVEGRVEGERESVMETARMIAGGDAERAGRIAERVMEELRLERLEGLLEELRGRHRLEWVMRAPLGRRVVMDAEVLGEAYVEGEVVDGGVEVVVFTDLECPVCARLDGELEKVRGSWGGPMGVRFVHFPLAGRAWSEEAAVVGEALRRRGGDFGVYKRALYGYGGQIGLEQIEAAARAALGGSDVDVEALRGDAAARERVLRMAGMARGLRMSGAPTVVVNGRVIGGFFEASELERRIRAVVEEGR